MADNRFYSNLGNGNRKAPARVNPDDIALDASTRISGSNLAVSQVTQELPLGDRKEWLKSLFYPETSLERHDRQIREAMRWEETRRAAVWAQDWRENRRWSRRNARKTHS